MTVAPIFFCYVWMPCCIPDPTVIEMVDFRLQCYVTLIPALTALIFLQSIVTAIAQRCKKKLSQNPGGARAPPCTCLRAPMRGAHDTSHADPIDHWRGEHLFPTPVNACGVSVRHLWDLDACCLSASAPRNLPYTLAANPCLLDPRLSRPTAS